MAKKASKKSEEQVKAEEQARLQNELETIVEQVNQILEKYQVDLSAIAISKQDKVIFTFSKDDIFKAAKLSAEMTNAIAEQVNKSIAMGMRG